VTNPQAGKIKSLAFPYDKINKFNTGKYRNPLLFAKDRELKIGAHVMTLQIKRTITMVN